jgi:MFS transporter, DHA2 family, multidrug resistance protein
METPQKQINKWLITIAVMLPTFMEIVDTSVANVALPHMQGSLNAGTNEITWVLTSYLVSNAVVLPMTGWLSRLFGRKRFFITCIALFTFASFLCGSAPNLFTLIVFRIIQGAAGGALMPNSQAILLETFPPGEQGMANAIFGIGAMFGPIVGPALGGWITDNMNWRWIFYVNIPIGIIAVFLAAAFIIDPHYLKRRKMTIDYWGLGLLTVGVSALQVVFDKGQQEDWFNSSFIVICFLVSMFSLMLLIYVELKHEHPVINLRLFRDVSFSSGNLIMFMVGFCLYSAVILIPLFLQTLMGYDATLAGMVLAPGGVTALLTMPFVGMIISKYDGRKIVFLGLLIGVYAMYIMRGFTLDASFWDFVWPRAILGAAFAMIFVPLTTVTLSTIPREEMGNATGLFNLLRNVGGSVGIATSATLLARFSQFYQVSLVSNITPFSLTLQEKLGALKHAAMARGVDAATADRLSLASLYGMVRRQADILAFNRIFWVIGLAFLATIPFLFLLKRPRQQKPAAMH